MFLSRSVEMFWRKTFEKTGFVAPPCGRNASDCDVIEPRRMSGSGKFLRGLADIISRSLRRALEQPLELEPVVVGGSRQGKHDGPSKQMTPKRRSDSRSNESQNQCVTVRPLDEL